MNAQPLVNSPEQTGERLRELEGIFREMLNGFSVHEIICDDQGRPVDYRFLAVNPAFEKMVGMKDADVRGRTVREIFPTTEQHWIDTYGKVALTGEPVHFIDFAKGIGKYFEVTAYRPAPRQFACIFADVTERKRAEKELRETHEFLKTVFDNSPIGIEIYDKHAYMIGANRKVVEMFGVDVQQYFGKFNLRTDPNYQYPEVWERLGRGEEVRHEIEFDADKAPYKTTKRGKSHYLIITTPIPDAVSARVGFIMQILDITERKQAEDALRESRHRYQALVEGVPGIVYSFSTKRGGLYYSPRALELLGRTPAELCDQPRLWHDSIHPDDVQRVDQTIRGAAAGQPFEVEYRIRDARGEWRWFVDLSLGHKVVGEEVIIEGFVLEISRRKAAEASQERLRVELAQAQKMDSIGRLAGGVAHDFNNMLQVILSNADVALPGLPVGDARRESLEEIRRCAHRSADLTRRLLAFARKQTIAPRILDLNETVEGMLKMLRRLIGENIDLAWLPGKNLGLVRMDPSQIDQILANLCVNARDAISETGRITIETDNVTIGTAEGSAHPAVAAGAYVRLTVGDNGCGMDAITQAHIFEPFFTTKAKGEGTGLGLATVYGIVTQNGGFITVESAPGRGATFRVGLPRHGDDTARQVETVEASPPHGRGELLLLVEDEPAILRIGQRALETLGYRVLAAATPEQALRLAGQHGGGIRLLITDVMMPGMDGRALAERLHAILPGLRCLYMSGHTANVLAPRGLLATGVHFIAKPFTVETLAAKVRDLLEGA